MLPESPIPRTTSDQYLFGRALFCIHQPRSSLSVNCKTQAATVQETSQTDRFYECSNTVYKHFYATGLLLWPCMKGLETYNIEVPVLSILPETPQAQICLLTQKGIYKVKNTQAHHPHSSHTKYIRREFPVKRTQVCFCLWKPACWWKEKVSAGRFPKDYFKILNIFLLP